MKLKAVEKAAAISPFPAFRIKFQSIQLFSSACSNSVLNQSEASKFCRSTNQDQAILPYIEGKLRKNALHLNQSAFSNFALYVINLCLTRTVYSL